MAKLNRWFVILLLTIFLIGSSFSYTLGKNKDQIVLIIINQLSFYDQTKYKNIDGFKQLEQDGIKGAMNLNSASSRSDANSYLTIGAGSRGIGVSDMGNSYQSYESIAKYKGMNALEVYEQQTGSEVAERDDLILFLPIEKLRDQIQKFPFYIGALGESLKQAGLTVKVYGNNDTFERIRYAPLITMDQTGLSYGDVSENTLIKDRKRPFGVKTNYLYLLEKWRENRELTDLLIFDLGDLYRLEQFRDQMNNDYEEQLRNVIYQEIGQFIQTIINQLNQNQTLIVLSPMVGQQAVKEDMLLSPVWVYHGQEQGNFLISGTTKRPGIVANIDIAPTILEKLEVKQPSYMLGQKIKSIDENLSLEEEIQQISTTYRTRATVLYTYVGWQIFILILSIWVWLRNYKRSFSWIQIGLLSMLFMPFLLLVTADWISNYAYLYLGTLIGISLVLAWLVQQLKPIKAFFLVGILIFLSITLDTFMGGPLMKRSYLGYDPIIGARYYGIGNEFMGVYIGATLLFISHFLQMKKNGVTFFITLFVFAGISFILLYPTLGTNAGGAISAIVGTGIATIRFAGLTFNKKGIIWMLLILVLGLGMLLFINSIVPIESKSHIGRALSKLYQGDFTMIFQTIERKLAMNFKLIQVSSWSKVMVTSIFAMAIIFLKPQGTLKRVMEHYPDVFHGFFGIVAASITALFVNDSGVVAASTMIIFAAVPMLFLAINEERS
ncbi:hypothetical protein [Tepidibacillus sp. HK-1]|uniref:hypothetical protein n=1 Tax=Tepidibacillus sp. HK-1 TaxID=1883407 RepID=UPI0008537AD0|nr:hypothetical protein [Tepidibacillus sp. HK-1]GBF11931.1 hypothetical protein HK1_01991 [Tepidibacillus sp. HK-1]